jgi:integrase
VDYPKWKLITTHTMRRSFATNEYLKGTPIQRIMAATGHKSVKSFFKYIKEKNFDVDNVKEGTDLINQQLDEVFENSFSISNVDKESYITVG